MRPVDALHVDNDIYIITSVNSDRDDEEWLFKTGDRVKCIVHRFSGGDSGLRAIEKVE